MGQLWSFQEQEQHKSTELDAPVTSTRKKATLELLTNEWEDWKKIKSWMDDEDKKPVSEYLTHFNGGDVYHVTVDRNKKEATIVLVYRTSQKNVETNEWEWVDPPKDPVVPKMKFERCFVGFCPYYERELCPGNSLLFRLKDNEYMYVGYSVKTFKSLAPVEMYVSTFPFSGVVHPFALDTENNFYFPDPEGITWDFEMDMDPEFTRYAALVPTNTFRDRCWDDHSSLIRLFQERRIHLQNMQYIHYMAGEVLQYSRGLPPDWAVKYGLDVLWGRELLTEQQLVALQQEHFKKHNIKSLEIIERLHTPSL